MWCGVVGFEEACGSMETTSLTIAREGALGANWFGRETGSVSDCMGLRLSGGKCGHELMMADKTCKNNEIGVYFCELKCYPLTLTGDF